MGNPLDFDVVKHVTVPVLKVPDDGTPVYFKSNGAIYKAKPLTAKESTEPAKQPPELMEVTELQSGEIKTIIINTVLGTELRDKYPNDGYVNKQFRIRKYKMQGGKAYATFEITEIRLKNPSATSSAKPVVSQGKR